MDQAALTGESLPAGKKVGDQCFSGSLCKQGEAECVVIGTGANTFFGRAATLVGADDDSAGHLQKILARIGLFCMVSIGLWIVSALRRAVEYLADPRSRDPRVVPGVPLCVPPRY